ncbi:MAG: hypothetical protein ACYST6_15865 [Planctomycetota bacterium]
MVRFIAPYGEPKVAKWWTTEGQARFEVGGDEMVDYLGGVT